MNGYEEYGLMPGGKVSCIPMQGFDIVATIEAASILFEDPESGSESTSIVMNNDPSCRPWRVLCACEVEDALTQFLSCLSMQRPSLQSNHLSAPSPQLVFESPVRSGFLMPRGINHNRNRSAFSPEVKRPDRTAKNCSLQSFCSL
ncbi:uncharacterized protein LACBIDRAFT_297063 [Laccaria bicolor S238N-H82]|uniref:Predicted protein n=1 Tax=Laccaria bicolor (strain S238N-H82 / ATCC MYA-4686) TaxID=486041 RepID=B0D9X0_LACBS|nr:uncharacterized protein LACBIDRAFT_297063 [Laccaria bicolor S238N-H82]EDR08659.1 predicted protein [Laccaria bicolor S238N-H82]|eukprot:XP_001880884.1 predicted protein [Laccaria bicolor S238N-H82]